MSQNPIKLTVVRNLYTDQINVTQTYGDVDIGICGDYSYDELPEWLRAKLATLDVLCNLEHVEGLGYRFGGGKYLVEHTAD